MSISEVIRRIKPEQEYNLSHIKDEGLFPWTKNLQTIRKTVKKDYWGENMLKACISGTGGGVDYRLKGKYLVKFLKRYGEGLLLSKNKDGHTNSASSRGK